MTIINFVTAICFAILTAEVLYMVISLLVKNRADRIAFLRSFKKGKCAIIYFSAIPLFCIGHMYAGADFIAAFFSAVNQIINLVVLKYSTSTVQALMDANLFYTITMYYGFVLVGLNALFFTFSLVGQRLWEFRQSIKAKITSKDKLFILGYNQNSVAVYNSDTARSKVIIDKISEQDGYSLYTKKISFVSCTSFDSTIAQIFKIVGRGEKQYTVVVNTDSKWIVFILNQVVEALLRESKKKIRRLGKKFSIIFASMFSAIQDMKQFMRMRCQVPMVAFIT